MSSPIPTLMDEPKAKKKVAKKSLSPLSDSETEDVMPTSPLVSGLLGSPDDPIGTGLTRTLPSQALPKSGVTEEAPGRLTEADLPSVITGRSGYKSVRFKTDNPIVRLQRWVEEELRDVQSLSPLTDQQKEWIVPAYKDLAAMAGSAQERAHAEFDVAVEKKALKGALQVALALLFEMDNLHRQMFTMGADRAPTVKDGTPEKTKYGYHLTKVHNIPGIAKAGLDPNFGASDKGSVAASTQAQKTGSEATSSKMIAFGVHPSTFAPYVSQYEDRRQMIEGTPKALKPIMLRFVIAPSIGQENVLEGVDYMHMNARNSAAAVGPQFIEALTPQGWVPVTAWKPDAGLVEHRVPGDNDREGMSWGGHTPLVMTWMDLITTFPDLASLNTEYATQAQGVVAKVRNMRDKVMPVKGVTFTFRGATMQTSGAPNSWEWAFTVAPPSKGELPDWLNTMIKNYAIGYAGPAKKLLAEYDEWAGGGPASEGSGSGSGSGGKGKARTGTKK